MTPMQAAAAAMDHPWRWGTHDCCASACSAFATLTGVDPMAPLRGLYATAEEARDLIEAQGGWVAMAEALARQAGLNAVAGRVGALGLAAGVWGRSLAFGVGPGLWAAKSRRGFVLLTEVERAWV
jgi:hypothetical protein